uniref:C-type lectin domain-containing protein n=1 Tax=Ictidomys tridecemlineatus TaxID=43179 RepID=I3LZ02_ICTTR
MLSTLPLPSMSWMLLPCLMLLSQVQDEIPLPLSLSGPKGSKVSGSLLFSCFTTMQLACQKWSEGHLVSVLSEAEAQFLSSLVKSSVNSYQYVWIGTLHLPSCWSSTDVLNYANWERNPSTA